MPSFFYAQAQMGGSGASTQAQGAARGRLDIEGNSGTIQRWDAQNS